MSSIIVFTQFYPYTNYDAYFKVEIEELSNVFEKVILVSSANEFSIRRNVPSNVKAVSISVGETFRRRQALRHIFNPLFYKECRIVLKQGLLISPAIISHVLASISNAIRYEKFILELMQQNSLSPDGLIIYSQWMLDHAFAAAKIKRQYPSVRVVARAHSFEIYRNRSRINYQPMRQQTFNLMDKLAFVSDFGRKYFEDNYIVTKEQLNKLSVHRLGVEPALHPQTAYKTDSTLYIVSNAFISNIKRIDLIAKALALLPPSMHVNWVHFGNVYKNEESFEMFTQQIHDILKYSLNISYHFPGAVSIDEITSYYSRNFVDFIVNVSQTEGIPVSLMEACSFGIPIIATAVGGNPEIVQEDFNGYLLPENVTPQNLAYMIVRYFNLSNQKKQALRNASYSIWTERFNATENYHKFISKVILDGNSR